MASFSAELHVASQVFPVLHCAYGVHQATHQRGRVSTKVRHEPVYLTLAVPDNDALLAWAADPHKRQAAHVVFRDANGGAPVETLALGAAYCVSYQEEFVSGEARDGAYVCHLVLTDPAGFTMQAGGPAGAYVAPPAREHGVPGAALPFVAGPDGVPRLPRITGAPPFTIKGPSKGKPGLDRGEFARQLFGQQHGLNRLTVAQFLANRNQYLTKAATTGDGRAAGGNTAQKLARAIAFRRKADELQAKDEDLSPDEAETQAQQWLDTQAALHDPDQVAGGHADTITGLGSARVNSSIGAQWPKRIKGIDAHIRKHAAGMTQRERETTFLDVELPMT